MGKSYELASNPHREGTATGATEAAGWTLKIADVLGRHCRTLNFAGASLPAAVGCTDPAPTATANTTWTYGVSAEGRQVDQTDPLSVMRFYFYDAAAGGGRGSQLVEVRHQLRAA